MRIELLAFFYSRQEDELILKKTLAEGSICPFVEFLSDDTILPTRMNP